MKLILPAFAAAAVMAAPPQAKQAGKIQYKTMATYMEKNFSWANFDQEVKNAVEAGYNRIYLGFYMALHGCQGACTAWRDLNPSTKQDVLSYLQANNAYLGLSVGGPGEFIEGVIRDGTTEQFAQQAAQFAQSQGFLAMDFATELAGELTQPSVWALNGSYSEFIGTMVKGAKDYGSYTIDQISLTSPAQYFSPEFVKCDQATIDAGACSDALSYFALDKNANQGFAVGHINMDMLNEDGNYMDYQDIFIDNTYVDPYGYGKWGNGSAVQQIVNLGISTDKVAIVKSQSQAESSVLNGYVSPSDLHDWGCQANAAFGWNGGFVGWTWNSNDGYDTLNWPGTLNAAC